VQIVRGALRLLLAALFRVNVSGLDNMPAGSAGFILAGAPHRNWVEPVLLHAFVAPPGRRVVTVADARAVSGSVLRRVGTRLIGGVIPVGKTAALAPLERVQSAASAVTAGDLVAIFPEIGGPSRPPRLRPLSAGVGRMSTRSRAAVVPIVFGGTDELYLHRRIEVRILAPVQPPVGNDRASITRWTQVFTESLQTAATEAHEAANVGRPRHKRWRWLTGNYPRVD
jgi:1-acyl-sn-glycerol-3-phosphate acyltransferase